jgi:hypothetical protein
VLRLLVTANVVPSLPILVTLMMEAINSSKKVDSYKSHMASHPRRWHLQFYTTFTNQTRTLFAHIAITLNIALTQGRVPDVRILRRSTCKHVVRVEEARRDPEEEQEETLQIAQTR